MARYKHLIGPKLRTRSLPAQRGEVAIAVAVLNTMSPGKAHLRPRRLTRTQDEPVQHQPDPYTNTLLHDTVRLGAECGQAAAIIDRQHLPLTTVGGAKIPPSCTGLIFYSTDAPLVAAMRPGLPKLTLLVCLDAIGPHAPSLDMFLAGADEEPFDATPADDLAMIAGTTGTPKGVMLSGHNLEAMSCTTLVGYPFAGRPVYLALAPLTHAAGVLCSPIMMLGGRVVIMAKPDLGDFLRLVGRYGVTHTFLPPTLIYMLLKHPGLAAADLRSLQCFRYGAAPISTARLAEAIDRIGPVMAQLFGQMEAPIIISTMAPTDHFDADGTIAADRLSSAGRPSPLTQVAIMDADGALLPAGARGEIVVRGPLVMLGYYKNPTCRTAPSSACPTQSGVSV